MRPPLPVIIDVPQDIALPQSACVIIIGKHDWVFVMNRDSTECRTAKEFHDFIEEKGGRSLNGNVALQTESNLLSQIDKTIALLKQDSIVRFHLITDLDK